MRIQHVEAIVTCPGRNFVLVKITTDTNLVGWGDATLNGRELAVATLVNEHLAPLLIGEDATRIEHHWNALYTGAYWRGGPIQNTALAGIDMALWDLLGKHAGLPVYKLLGGRVREGALAYVHAAGEDHASLIDAVRRKTDAGFKAVRIQTMKKGGSTYGEKKAAAAAAAKGEKIKPPPGTPVVGAEATVPAPIERGQPMLVQTALPLVGEWEPRPYLNSVPKMFAAVREAVGDEVELLHDVHHRLSPIEAALLAKEIEPYHPFFYEDPVAPEYKEGLELIRKHSAVPIAIGEGFFDIAEFTNLVTGRLLDYIRCDLGHIGGISAAKKIAHFCEPYCIKTAWHGPPDLGPVGHAANVHVDLSTHNFGVQEWYDHSQDQTMSGPCKDVFGAGVIVRDGRLDVPETPGLGVTVNEDAARKYAYQRAYLPVVRREDGSVHPW